MDDKDIEIQELRFNNKVLRSVTRQYRQVCAERSKQLHWVMQHPGEACKLCVHRDKDCKPGTAQCEPKLEDEV